LPLALAVHHFVAVMETLLERTHGERSDAAAIRLRFVLVAPLNLDTLSF
jgi:hypothetical protein